MHKTLPSPKTSFPSKSLPASAVNKPALSTGEYNGKPYFMPEM